MKKMTGLFLSAILISILLGCKDAPGTDSSLFTEADIDTTLHIRIAQEGNLTIFMIDKYMTTVVKIPNISSYIYSQRPLKSLEQIANDSNYSLVVNSSFCDALYDDSTAHLGLHYRHAGFLKINDSIYENIKDDRQLSRIFAYSSKRNIVDYFFLNELDKTKDYDVVVQTGPLIIWKNEIDTASINSSINGNRQAIRTTFASVDGKELYVIVTIDRVTLADLGRMLRSTGIFKKELTIIDFDGGPSTKLFIRNHPELCWFSNVPWPLLICVK